MSMLGMGIFPFLLYYLYAIVPLAPLVYLFIKWRAYRNGRATDPWLGAAVLLHYFWTLALHLALFGLCLALSGLIQGGHGRGVQARPGPAQRRRDRPADRIFALSRVPSSPLRPQVWRVFNALNLLLCGLLALIGLVAAAILLADGKMGRRSLAAAGPGHFRGGLGLVPAPAAAQDK